MAIKIIKKVPSPEELAADMPISNELLNKIALDRKETQDILSGRDERLLAIVGPCSAWPYEPVLEYAKRLKELEPRLNKKLKILMRVYTQKPRTTKGWNGPINQPNPCDEPDVADGIRYTRSLMLDVLKIGLPIANEALFTHDSMKFFPNLLSWMAIGARSSEDQEHRIYASSVDCPVGMKNPTSGSIEIGVNSVIAAQNSHTTIFGGYQVITSGNHYTHLVLRGGNYTGPNFGIENILKAQELMKKNLINNSAIVIDASHDNCLVNGVKDVRRQIEVVSQIVEFRKSNPIAREIVRGFMLESFLKGGKQEITSSMDMSGLSITDPCLSWEDTEEFLLNLFGN